MTGHIVQINVSPGGVPKRSVPMARVTRAGLEGDAHRDTEHHGGPDRALCLFSLERIEALQAEGHPVEPGALGENLTVAGLDWARVEPEDFFRIGDEVLVRITRFTSPCLNYPPDHPARDLVTGRQRPIAPEEWATHHTFFPAGIGVIEYLVNLDRLGRDRVRFAALPLKLEGGDGAPARAIAILD